MISGAPIKSGCLIDLHCQLTPLGKHGVTSRTVFAADFERLLSARIDDLVTFVSHGRRAEANARIRLDCRDNKMRGRLRERQPPMLDGPPLRAATPAASAFCKAVSAFGKWPSLNQTDVAVIRTAQAALPTASDSSRRP
jgi:hypothetical protein